MKLSKSSMLVGLLFLGTIVAYSQAANEQGIKPYGSYHGTDIDQVNISSGHLELRVPLLSYPQRGNHLKLSFTGLYHNPVWNEHTDCAQSTNICIHIWEYDGAPGVSLATDQAPPFIDQQLIRGGTSAQDPPVYAYSIRMADGSQHPLGNIGGTVYNSLDATGMRWDSGSQTLTVGDGSRFPVLYGSAPVLEDTNGNQITFGTSITDTLGRTIPWPGGSGATQDFSGCTGGLPISSASLWIIPGSNGSSNTFKFCYAQVRIFTQHWALQSTSTQQYIEPNGPVSMLQSIVLPDLTAWTFDYSQPDANGINWGDLIKVTYPTGGSISYTWTHGQGCHTPVGVKGNWSGAVLRRTVDAQDGTGPHPWNYASGKVSDPLGNDTVHTFSDLNKSCSLYETKTDFYQGSQSGGTLLKTISTDYSWAINPNFPNTTGSPAPAINVVPIRKTISWPNGQVRKTEFSYDSGFSFNSGTSTGIYGKETVRNEFDYGAATALLKSTLTSYWWQDPAHSQYLTFNVLDVPSIVTVRDGSGNQVSQNTIAYDGALPGGSGVSTSHDLNPSNGNVRGNATSTSRWLNGSTVSTTNCPLAVTNGSLTSTKTYLDTGMVSQVKDACLQPTNFQFSSVYAGAYLTGSCDSLNHCTSMDYDFNTGSIASSTDPNGQVTGRKTTYTYDNIGRLTNVAYPDGGQTNAYYPNSTTVEVKKLQDSAANIWLDTYSYFDGLLRPSQTRLVDPEGDVYSETTYDELGRTSKVTNPHRSVSAPTDGTTTTNYDALGRVVKVIRPDGNMVQTNYSDPAVMTLIDETGRSRRHTINALGQLIKLEEPAANGNSGTNATAQLAIGGTLQTKAAMNATPGMGSITFNGAEQNKPGAPAKPGRGSISITGTEASTTIDPCSTQGNAPLLNGAIAKPIGGSPCPKTIYDQGSVTITVNGHPDSAPYKSGSDTTTIATGLAAALNADSASSVTATASGSTVTLTSKATGAASNYAFSGTSATTDAPDFGGPSFAPSPTGGALSSGADAGSLVYDSGTCLATINGMTYTVAFGQGDTPTTIASRVASAVNAGTWASATASGPTVSLTAKTAGSATNYSLNASCSYNSSLFSGASFTTASSGPSLTGGADSSPAVTDAGTITLSISSYSATANYGSGTGQDSTAAAIASDLVTKLQAQMPANPGFSISVPNGGTTIAISWNTAGVVGNVGVTTASTTTQTSNFSKPSFASCVITNNPQNCNATLSGGTDPFSLDSPPAWPTLYSYNLLGDLLRVEQHGNSADSSQWRVRTFQYDSLSRLTQSINPEAGQLNFTYDADGGVVTRKDGRGLTITYAYDPLHRLTQRSYSDLTPAESFAYDQTSLWGATLSNTIGRLTYGIAAGNTAASVLSYDPMGRVTNEWVCLPSNCGTSSYATTAQYDLAGHLQSLTYPSGRTVTSGYNSAGRALNSVFSNFGSLSVNYPYYTTPQAVTPSTWGYNPNGSLHVGTFGNGITETYGFNNRQQLNSITASSSGQTWLSKLYGLYDANSHNNGSIWSIIDGISTARNQFYQYDSIGRVISGYQQDNAFNQTFSYDPWGNMTTSGTNNFNPLYDGNNRVSGAPANCTASNAYCYDAAGNMLNDAFHQYAYDGDNRLKAVDSTGANYTYGAGGERVRKDMGGKGTEYVYFQGSAIAEKDVTTGYWSDYIFFNGRRIARATNFEHHLHVSGQVCANCGWQSYQFNFTNLGTLAGRVIQAGDSLRWVQWQNTGSAGGIIMSFTDGTDSCCTSAPALADQNGELILRSARMNQADYRVVSLSPDAGKKISQIRLSIDGTTQPGQWDIFFQDLVYVGADGSVWPLFSQNATLPALSGAGSAGMTQASASIHDCSGSGCAATNTTTYFHGDQIGSARLLSDGWGYAVWQGTFTPFGQEVSPELTTNHYKFSGKERGEASEGGLDYFSARYYSSVIGRWMTPDWSDEPSAVPYAKLTDPQSLNLYSYVTDDPLSHTDLGGHFQTAPGNGPCPNNNGNTCGAMSSAYKCSVGMTTFCQQAADELAAWAAQTGRRSDGTGVSGGKRFVERNIGGAYVYDNQGHVVGSVGLTVVAYFSEKPGEEGKFLGAEITIQRFTANSDGTFSPMARSVDTRVPINYGQAARILGESAMSGGAFMASQDKAFFATAVGNDLHDHPWRALGRLAQLVVYTAGLAEPPVTGWAAAGMYATLVGTVADVGNQAYPDKP